MDAPLRPSGIEELGDTAWGTHFCLFYETKEDLLSLCLPFFKAGLAQHIFCLYVASEPLLAEDAHRAMRQAYPDFERHLAEGQLEITPYTDWYLKDGRFDEQRVLKGWLDKLDQALSRGFAGLRFAANILLEPAEWDSFARYESRLEDVLRDTQIEALCAYDLNRYPASSVLDVIRHHQFTLARRGGRWESVEGASLKRAHDQVLKLNAELERRVQERTAQLGAANEQLKREIAERHRSEEALRASEARLQTALQAADIGLWDWDLASGRVTSVGHHDQLFGFALGEFDGNISNLERRVHPDDVERLNRAVQRAREERAEYAQEYRVVWPDGSVHWISGRGRFVYDEAGQPVRMSGAVRDITQRKQAEEALRKSERVLREAESLGHTGSWEQDLVTGEIFNSVENLRLFFGDDRSKGTPFDDYAQAVHPDDRDYVLRRRAQLLAERAPGDIEYRVVWPDGSIHVIFGRATVVRDELGQAIRIYGTNVDITERKRAEEALRESEAKLREAQQLAHIGYWERDLIADRIIGSEEASRIFGVPSPDAVLSLAELQALIHPEDRPIQQQALSEALQGNRRYDTEYRIVRPDGDIRFVHARDEVISDEAGRPVRMFGTVQDITERRQAEEARRRAEELFRAIVEDQTELIVRWKPDGTRTFVNKAYCRTFGKPYEELVETSFWPLLAEPYRERELERIRHLTPEAPFSTAEHESLLPDGTTQWQEWTDRGFFDAQGHLVDLQSVGRDISERKRAEKVLRKSERVLREAEELGHTGSWEQDLVTGETFNSEANLRLFFGDDHSKGASFEDFVQAMHPDDREYVLQRRAQHIAEGQPGDIEYRVVWPDGSIHMIHRRATVVCDESGKAIRLYGTNVDITERKRAEEEIKRQAVRSATLARIAARLNQQLNLDAVVQAVCHEVVDTFAVSQATMSLYDKQRDLLVYAGGVNIPPEYAAAMEPISRVQFERYLQTMGPIMVVPDIQAMPDVPNAEFSSKLDVRTVVTAAMLRGQELIGVLVLGVNGQVREFAPDDLALLKAVSDQAAQAIANAQLFKAATEQREQLRILSAKVVEAQEAERRAVARELHDEIGQLLYAVSANLEAIQISPEAHPLMDHLAESTELVDEAVRQIRDLALELRPSMLDDFGLVPALTWLVERQAERARLEADFEADPLDLRLPPALETTIYRIVQAALTNVARHAHARHAHVSISRREAHVEVRVSDDGVGFDVAAARERARQGGTLGLLSMEERARLAGGALEIDSAPGHGTQVRARIPLDRTPAP